MKPLEQSNEEGRIKILKPHGSLNWLVPKEDVPAVIPLTSIGDIRYACSTTTFQWVKRPDEHPNDVGPCIVAPRSKKTVQREFLRQVRNLEAAELARADEVRVLGWSLPRTDADQESLIRRALAGGKLRRVTVATKGQSPDFFERIENVFDVARPDLRIFNDGFVEFASADLDVSALPSSDE